ncbi:hypothetical protein N9355_07515 [Crocinitomicaceae bacterium]|nr:hypothetical protein [Crocinitomicaceae bacterium]
MKGRYIIFALLILFVGTISVSCRKKEDTIAKILVRDANNQPVYNARVIVYGQSTTNQASSVTLYDTAYTNSAGEAIFNFNEVYQLGQAGVAVLNIDAEKSGLIGQGIIKVEQETTTEEVVFIN